MSFMNALKQAKKEGHLPDDVYDLFFRLYTSFDRSLASIGKELGDHERHFFTLLDRVKEQVYNPHPFAPFHKMVTEPFDYHKFGVEFFRPLVDFERSRVLYPENIQRMEQQIEAKENVVLFANHQTEIDPQLINIILEKEHRLFATDMIFVAGDRVVTDPAAIPFSLGRNLLCIYSKKHIEHPPEKKEAKQMHNKRTMQLMSALLQEGGRCIYVAPSGGRDRADENGKVNVAQFDPGSIEMFRLMAARAKTPTHFYPLALATYDILPPPSGAHPGRSEEGELKREGASFAFGDKINMDDYPGCELLDKRARREALAKHIWNRVNNGYQQLKQE